MYSGLRLRLRLLTTFALELTFASASVFPCPRVGLRDASRDPALLSAISTESADGPVTARGLEGSIVREPGGEEGRVSVSVCMEGWVGVRVCEEVGCWCWCGGRGGADAGGEAKLGILRAEWRSRGVDIDVEMDADVGDTRGEMSIRIPDSWTVSARIFEGVSEKECG